MLVSLDLNSTRRWLAEAQKHRELLVARLKQKDKMTAGLLDALGAKSRLIEALERELVS